MPAAVAVQSSDKAVLKAVLKAMKKSKSTSGWTMMASPSDDWKISFKHRDDNGICTEYPTDLKILNHAKKSGYHKFFSDSEPVLMVPATWVHASMSEAVMAAKFLHDGAELIIDQSCGSSSSSKHGISYTMLQVQLPGHYSTVTLGTPSLFINGVRVISGTVE